MCTWCKMKGAVKRGWGRMDRAQQAYVTGLIIGMLPGAMVMWVIWCIVGK